MAIYCIAIHDDADWDQNPRVLTEFAELTGGNAFEQRSPADRFGSRELLMINLQRAFENLS